MNWSWHYYIPTYCNSVIKNNVNQHFKEVNINKKMSEEMEVDRETAKKPEKMFTLKKWNLVAMWSWDVECDTCAICRVQVMGEVIKNRMFVMSKSF